MAAVAVETPGDPPLPASAQAAEAGRARGFHSYLGGGAFWSVGDGQREAREGQAPCPEWMASLLHVRGEAYCDVRCDVVSRRAADSATCACVSR